MNWSYKEQFTANNKNPMERKLNLKKKKIADMAYSRAAI